MRRSDKFHCLLPTGILIFACMFAACTSKTDIDTDLLLQEKEHASYAGSGILHTVPDDFPTIQAALDAAGLGDTVAVQDGVYKGPGNINLDFKGKTILLRSKNGPDSCIIDCEGKGRGIYFHTHEGLDSLIDGFTIRNAYVRGDNLDGFGGGIFCLSTSPRINNCRLIANCAGSSGGGICSYGDGTPIISNCVFSDNISPIGGGISSFFGGSPLIKDCTFRPNKAPQGTAIYVGRESSPNIVNCAFTEKSRGNILIQDSSSKPRIIDSEYE